MDPSNLIAMANRIGDFFDAMPNREQATEDVATHILRTWEPRMRTALLALSAAAGDRELKPIVRDALARLRER
jgi:formate dehydrogenase subunit delta